MIVEFLGGLFVTLIGVKFYLAKTRPKHFIFEGISTWDHSSYDCFRTAMRAQAEGLKIHSEPFIELFGIPLMYNHSIDDADVIRSFFNTDKAQAHTEMEGFWSLMCQYRELTNKKGAFKITEKELGTMQEMNPLNQKNTATMKLARRHFLGYTSAPKIFQVNFDRVTKESEDLIDEALKQCQNGTKSIDPQVWIMDATTANVLEMACGFSYRQGTKIIRKIADNLQLTLSELIGPHNHKLIFMLIPRPIRQFIPLKYWPSMCESVGEFYDFLHDVLDEHETKYNIEDEPTCLLDTMRQDYVKGKFTYSDIFHTMQSMLIAAIDTTSTQAAIVWSNLARWPEWQKIVRDEVDNIPLSQIRKWDDVPKLAAFMYETIRWNPAVFRNLYHTATREIECAGYTFGKDTLFSYNIAAVSMNEKYFPEPFKFDPNRFLSDDGSLKRDKNLMPFGYGKRSCPGAAIAELQILLFSAHVLKRCEIVMDPERPLLQPKTEQEWFDLYSRRPTYELGGGLMLVENINVIVKERKN